ncbi:MAG: SO_0444 family Cu/Zn efflux transporter [Prevotella sp.]|nr:SO_0444 family Cu/Zn efflux transporter [Prevotella sp.]
MEQILHLINEMSPFLLLGFLLAGLMHAFIPGQIYSRYLAKPTFSSVLYAALFGIPLPLCSCGVIPTAMSLRREGASKGAVASFLIATPQTGVDSIIATYSLMGLPFAIIRPFIAFLTALFGGQMVNAVEPSQAISEGRMSDSISNQEGIVKAGCSCGHEHEHNHEHHHHGFIEKLRSALSYAFLEMMEDIGKWLMIGLIVAGLITVFVPDSFFEIFKDNSLASMLLVLCFSIPMYLCATGSIPIAVALMLKGLTPGAALVLLMAGPACNMASILVINKVMGRKTLITYLASIIIGAVGFGLAIDHLLPREWFIPTIAPSADCCHEETSLFSWTCTGVLVLLLINAAWHHYHGGHTHCHCHDTETCDSPTKTYNMEITIKGMNCNHCRANAEKAILACNGVTSASVDLASGKAQIDGNADINEIRSAIEAIGFSVES